MSPTGPANHRPTRKNHQVGEGDVSARRRWDRLPIAIPIFVRGSDETGREFVEFTTAANINPGGMLLVSRRSLPVGLLVTLEIPTPTPFFQAPGQLSRSALSARVLYENFSEGYHLCGMEFIRPLLNDAAH